MAALFRSLFACCFGQADTQTPGPHETDPLLGQEHVNGHDDSRDDDSMRTGYYDERRAQELNQKVADIVTNGTGRMLTPVLLRGNAVYSPVLPNASSSQANLPARQLPAQSPGNMTQQQRESRHSSQSSRHSSYKQHHPSLHPHVESIPPPSEDGGALDPNQSLTAGVGNSSQTNFLGYGTTALGASATGRRFQIHRGRPPSRAKPTENGVGTAVQAAQTNGVPLGSETGDEPKQRSTSSSDRPPTSPPRAINNSKSEEASAERPPDFNEKRQVHFKLPPGDLILQYED